MINCGAENDDPATADLTAAETTQSQVFAGKVVTPAGAPISGARVTINGINRITSSTGQYAVSIADSTSGYRVDIRKDGFGPATEFHLAGSATLVHKLQTGSTFTINPATSNEIFDQASGISINVPANSLRTSTGAPSAPVRLTIIPHTSQTMPGDFTARRADGRMVALVSVGAVTVQAVDSKNNTLGLAAGASLNVNLPVPAAAGSSMPACVLNGSCRTVMWRFEPTTGLWVEQATAAPAFNTGGTTFAIRGQRGGAIDPGDGLGTWNADIEFSTPACMVIELSNIPLACYNPPPGSTPEPGIAVTFTQALAGGGTKSKTSDVRSSAAFVVLYNLRPNVDVDLKFAFPAGAPPNCASNMSILSAPGPAPGFPTFSITGGETRVSSGNPWGGTGMPTDGGGGVLELIDVISGNHPCLSSVQVTTF